MYGSQGNSGKEKNSIARREKQKFEQTNSNYKRNNKLNKTIK